MTKKYKMYTQQVKSGHKTGEETPNQHITQQRKSTKKARIDFNKKKDGKGV